MFFVVFEPGFQHLAVMDTQVIQNQKHFAVDIFNQPRQGLDQDLSGYVFTIHHKPNFSLIGDRRDHIAPTLGDIGK